MGILKDICAQKTLLLISHRLENLEFFNTIYVLEKGCIKERGTYQELIGNPNSLFNNLRSIANN